MKNVLKITVAVVMFVVATNFTSAQSKTAHINVQQLLSELPSMKAAQAELKKFEEQFSADIESSLVELQNKYKQYETEAQAQTEEENQRRAVELQGMDKNIKEAQNMAMQEMQKKQGELMQPILEKANAAIQTVAERLGFDYVVDASPGGGIIVAKGKDLLPEVKAELLK